MKCILSGCWRILTVDCSARLLVALCSNADSALFMSEHFNLRDLAAAKMEEIVIDDEVVVDEEHLYWRYIHGQLSQLGGPSEKQRLSLTLEEPKLAAGQAACSAPASDLSGLLSSAGKRLLDHGWLEECGVALRAGLAAGAGLGSTLVRDILVSATKVGRPAVAGTTRCDAGVQEGAGGGGREQGGGGDGGGGRHTDSAAVRGGCDHVAAEPSEDNATHNLVLQFTFLCM